MLVSALVAVVAHAVIGERLPIKRGQRVFPVRIAEELCLVLGGGVSPPETVYFEILLAKDGYVPANKHRVW